MAKLCTKDKEALLKPTVYKWVCIKELKFAWLVRKIGSQKANVKVKEGTGLQSRTEPDPIPGTNRVLTRNQILTRVTTDPGH